MSISDWSLIILRLMSAMSAFVDFRSSPYLPADCCISAYWRENGTKTWPTIKLSVLQLSCGSGATVGTFYHIMIWHDGRCLPPHLRSRSFSGNNSLDEGTFGHIAHFSLFQMFHFKMLWNCEQSADTLVWYHDSASALLRLAMSSYWARTSATTASMSRPRLLSISTTTDVSLIWPCSSWISCGRKKTHKEKRNEMQNSKTPFDLRAFYGERICLRSWRVETRLLPCHRSASESRSHRRAHPAWPPAPLWPCRLRQYPSQQERRRIEVQLLHIATTQIHNQLLCGFKAKANYIGKIRDLLENAHRPSLRGQSCFHTRCACWSPPHTWKMKDLFTEMNDGLLGNNNFKLL